MTNEQSIQDRKIEAFEKEKEDTKQMLEELEELEALATKTKEDSKQMLEELEKLEKIIEGLERKMNII